MGLALQRVGLCSHLCCHYICHCSVSDGPVDGLNLKLDDKEMDAILMHIVGYALQMVKDTQREAEMCGGTVHNALPSKSEC